MKTKNILLTGIFLFALILSMSFVIGADTTGVTAPTNGSNFTISSTITVTCAGDGTAVGVSLNNATFFYNLSGTATEIGVIYNTSAGVNDTLTGTLSLASLTAGQNYSISCQMWNGTETGYNDAFNSTKSGTHVTLYTNNATCGFTLDADDIDYMDPIGVETSDTSTKDALATLTWAWILSDSDGNSQSTSTSQNPIFSGTDFDKLGEFTLGLIVTDTFYNIITCTNDTVFVRGDDDAGQVQAIGGVTSIFQSNFVWWIIGIFIIIIVIGAVVFYVLSLTKK